jgi:nitrogen fixation/metabolism regulation signal transduction histidine kinase
MTMTTTTSSGHPGSYKRRIRNYLLDSHLQLRYAGFLVAVAVGISAIIGAVLYTTTRAVVSESAKVVEESRKASDESRKVSAVSRMNVRDLAPDSPELVAEFNREAEAYDRAIADRDRAVVAQQESLIQRQRWMLTSLVGGLALMVVLIGLFGIYFTHKVAGPIYKMNRLLSQVGTGDLRVDARLRRGDELQAFFDTFTRMVSGLRDVEAQRLRDVEAALESLEHGQGQDAAAILEGVRKAIREALG